MSACYEQRNARDTMPTSARIHLHADDLIITSFDKIIFYRVFQGISADRTRIRNSLVQSVLCAIIMMAQTSARTDRESRSAFASSVEGKLRPKLKPHLFPCSLPLPLRPLSGWGEICGRDLQIGQATAQIRSGGSPFFFDRRSSAVRGGFRLPETVPTIPTDFFIEAL